VKALLRFQAVALVRSIPDPVVTLVALAGLMAYGATHGSIVAGAPVLAIAAFWGMNRTIEAMDAARWPIPIRRRDALSAHLVFWLTICTPPVVLIALGRALDVRGAAILFFHLSLLVLAAATLVIFFQCIARRGRGLIAVVAGVAVGSTLLGPTVWSFVLAWEGRWESLALIGVVACICTALGVPTFLREEFGPPATSGAVVSAQAPATERAAWSPVATLLRATYSPIWIGFSIVFGGVLPLVFTRDYVFAIWTPLAASSLAGFGLQTWRWLAATPIDRDRAFRILFGPALAFVLVVTGVRLAIVETTSDRSVFFRDDRREGFRYIGSSTLTLAELLETGPSGNGYRPAEAHRVAAGVRDHLLEQFGATVPLERIEADLGRGWPQQPTAGATDDDMGYVLDGLERVRLDLADDIASASRRRDLAIAAGLVLAFLAMLRAQLRGRVLGVLLVIVVGLPLAMLAVFRRDFPAYAAAADSTFAALTNAPPPVLWLALAGACALGAFLWRSARKAFRRIDLLDLPPSPLVSSKR
jgi:hypothetical protein